jgi:3-phenylpropionate/trans-cinnamate dioxygenase ferredoxin reductase subunit
MGKPIVIVGAGQAAAAFISRHIRLGNDTALHLIGDEPVPPYQRPPLSKKYLTGELECDRLFIRPPQWYAEQGITTDFGTRVDRIDRDTKQIITQAGDIIAYDKLLLCTGSSARKLPAQLGGELQGVYTLRNMTDIDSMAPEFQAGRKLLIIGGGYIGLEVAASARKLGLQVTLLEMAERILQRVAAPQTSDYFRNLHKLNDVDIRESARMKQLLESAGRVCGAVMEDGEKLQADLVLVGIGGSANTELAEQAGLDCDNGIAVNNTCQTCDPDIYAAGDCTSFIRNGQRIRLESVQNASDQGDLIAQVLAGEDLRYDALPWFWSDQYDCKLQIAGLNIGYTRTVTRPGANDNGQSIWYYKDDQLLAVDAMNDAKAYAFGRKIISAGIHPSPAEVSDPGTDLKALAT